MSDLVYSVVCIFAVFKEETRDGYSITGDEG
jgi:hypothetical protein